MAITNIWWDGGGYDLHILLGESSQPLRQKLRCTRITGNSIEDFRGDNPPPDVTVQFVGEFKGTPSAHGITFVPSTGQISVANALPTPRLHNFIVRVKVSESGGNTLETQIRVHIHESIQKIWLTPTTLTLYHGTTNQQFTVLAEFEDGTNGDITGRGGLAYISSETANVTVAANGKLTSVRPNQSSEITATFGPLPPPSEMMSTATVFTQPSLAQARTITRVRGIGPVNFDNKPNILFLPEGFAGFERLIFNQVVDRIVQELQTDGRTFPYNLLKDSINYWRLDDADFVQSFDQNVGVLAEMEVRGRRSMRGKLVPFPVRPLNTATNWELENLVYMVGLPVPADSAKSRATKLSEWDTLYDGIVASKISDRVFNSWRAMAHRKLINERNTAFGIAINDYPRVDIDQDRVLYFHDRRTTSSQFRSFLAQLQHGETWTTGKDRNLVCVVVRSERLGGSESEPLFASTLGESLEDRLQAAPDGLRGIDVVPMKLTKPDGKLQDLHPTIVPTVAHECAHAFGLGDEYGGGFNFPSHEVLALREIGNVQPASELIVPPSNAIDADRLKWKWPRIKAAGVLTGIPTKSGNNFQVTLQAGHGSNFAISDLVRLRKRNFISDRALFSGRHKISSISGDTVIITQVIITPDDGTPLMTGDFPADSLLIASNTGAIGVLTFEPLPVPGSSDFQVTLKAGHANRFAIDDIVQLRKSAFSDRFLISAPLSGDQVLIFPLAGGTLKPGDFPEGSLLIATVPKPASPAPVGDELQLIAPIILNHIARTDGPLNAPRNNPTRICAPVLDSSSMMTPTNLPDG